MKTSSCRYKWHEGTSKLIDTSNPHPQLIGHIYKFFRAANQPISRLLDIGCGDGAFITGLIRENLIPAATEVTLIEPDSVLLEEAAERIRQAGTQRVNTLNMCLEDVIESREHLGEFELVACIHSLYYISNIKSSLRYMIDSLSLGGYLAIVLRSSNCDGFKIRKIFRNKETAGTTKAEMVSDILQSWGVNFYTVPIEFKASLPNQEVDEFLIRKPPSLGWTRLDAIVKLMGHSGSGPLDHAVSIELRRFLQERRFEASTVLNFADQLIVIPKG